jgi:hypothetical protein
VWSSSCPTVELVPICTCMSALLNPGTALAFQYTYKGNHIEWLYSVRISQNLRSGTSSMWSTTAPKGNAGRFRTGEALEIPTGVLQQLCLVNSTGYSHSDNSNAHHLKLGMNWWRKMLLFRESLKEVDAERNELWKMWWRLSTSLSDTFDHTERPMKAPTTVVRKGLFLLACA